VCGGKKKPLKSMHHEGSTSFPGNDVMSLLSKTACTMLVWGGEGEFRRAKSGSLCGARCLWKGGGEDSI
jgi:hypothetical protein